MVVVYHYYIDVRVVVAVATVIIAVIIAVIVTVIGRSSVAIIIILATDLGRPVIRAGFGVLSGKVLFYYTDPRS